MPQKVLIVDDEPLIRVLYQKHLEGAGYQLLTAQDGAEVLEMALRERPQAIVMDVLMAKMDGLAALRGLKKNEATKAIPVVIITAHVGAHHALRQEAETCGAALLLTKPFSPSQLLAALRQVCPTPETPGPSA
jgi:CheY-like chemotaxis protein